MLYLISVAALYAALWMAGLLVGMGDDLKPGAMALLIAAHASVGKIAWEAGLQTLTDRAFWLVGTGALLLHYLPHIDLYQSLMDAVPYGTPASLIIWLVTPVLALAGPARWSWLPRWVRTRPWWR